MERLALIPGLYISDFQRPILKEKEGIKVSGFPTLSPLKKAPGDRLMISSITPANQTHKAQIKPFSLTKQPSLTEKYTSK